MEAATIRTTAAVADGPFAGERWAAVGCGKRRERRYEPEGERLSSGRGHAGREESCPGARGARGHGVPLRTVAALRPFRRLPAMVLMGIRISFSQKSRVKVNIRYFDLQ